MISSTQQALAALALGLALSAAAQPARPPAAASAPFATVGQAVMADRYTYLPYIGLLFAFAWWLDDAPSARHGPLWARPLIAGVLVLLLPLSIGSINHAQANPLVIALITFALMASRASRMIGSRRSS